MNIFPRIVEIGQALYDPAHSLRCFHVSFIIYKGRLISIATNSPKTHSINLKNPKFDLEGNNISGNKQSCSELRAILKFKRMTNINLNKCILINIRVNRNGQLANSHPCSSCQSLLEYHKFKDVYFTNDQGKFEKYLN